jgi:hypothetical protein
MGVSVGLVVRDDFNYDFGVSFTPDAVADRRDIQL